MKDSGNPVCIDLGMTGLNPFKYRMLEVATLVADSQSDILADGLVVAIHQPKDLLAVVEPWTTQQHRKTGVIERSGEEWMKKFII
jgi:oligoribonuclease